ncbi:MAG TPA: tetratricopeptide repeat protein [Desulfobacteraceae bacterium]|nr:tetratricopeptide repeat protein [Desulfobacteraceae bacterium]
MKFYPKSISILSIILFFFLLALPSYLSASIQPSISVSNKSPMKRIISITTEQTTSGTIINVSGDGIFSDYTTKIIDYPPRIVVDMFYAGDPLESMTFPAKSPILKSIRVGYHPKIIRLVLDIKGPNTPIFRTKSANNKLTIFLRARELVRAKSKQIRRWQTDKELPALEQLTKIEADDGKKDTALFLKCVNAYRAKNWSGTIENLSYLIQTYPAGRYTERAYFLRAKSYGQLYSRSIVAHFTEIKRYYEDAVNKFSDSIYVQGALLAIGNLCFKSKNYNEALGYYNLVIKKGKGSIAALKASIKKATILRLKKKRKDALSILESVIYQYPGLPEGTEAKIEMSKLLYEMNNFRRSIEILSDVRKMHPETIYRYPDVFLYLGYNYYQVKEYKKARENLFRFYNCCPDRDINHLILTKIADTYSDEGLIEDAVKIYQLVFELYPDTEGAIISMIRFAEQQERGELGIDRGIASPVKIIGKDIDSPREIYENIMNNLLKKDEKNPLAQLAMLKLAVLYQREKDYDKSLKALKELLKKYPRTSLKKECKYALNKTLEAILKEEMKKRRYKNIINIYNRERNLFSMINSADPFLIIARASTRLKLHDMATEMFIRADSLLPDNEKPADLLFYVGSHLFKKKDEIRRAFSRLDLLIDHYPTNKNTPYAYQLKGQILFKQKKYLQAAEMFSSALRYRLKRCDRAKVLVEKASALMRCNLHEKALKATMDADKLKRNCYIHYPCIYHEIGDLYLHLGYTKKGLSIFETALGIEKEEENKIQLKLKIAQCYKLLDKKKDCLALYNEISGLNDPFWRNLAKERIDAINFAREMRETKKE